LKPNLKQYKKKKKVQELATLNNELSIYANYAIHYIYHSKHKNDIHFLLKKAHILPIELAYSIIEHYHIAIDYDDVLIHLIEPWIEYLNTFYSHNDDWDMLYYENVVHFDFFKELQEKYPHYDIFRFLKLDVYSKTPIRNGGNNFFNLLKEYEFKNYHIVSATYKDSLISKYEHILKTFHLTKNHIIFAYDKAKAFNTYYGTLIDDGTHNIINVLNHSDYAHCFLVNAPHNIHDLLQNERVIKIDQFKLFENVWDFIPLMALKNILLLKKDKLMKLY